MTYTNINNFPAMPLNVEMSEEVGRTMKMTTTVPVRYALCFDAMFCVVSELPFSMTVTLIEGEDTNIYTRNATLKDLTSSEFAGVFSEYAPTYNTSFNTTLTYEKASDFFNGNTFYVADLGGYASNFVPSNVSSSGAMLITSIPNFQNMGGDIVYSGNVGKVTRSGASIWYFSTTNGAEIIPSGHLQIQEPTQITHTIYLEGTGASVWVKTEHNITTGYVDTEWLVGVGSHPIGGWIPYKTRCEYEHYGRIANDRPALKFYTWNSLHTKGENNQKCNSLEKLSNPDIYIKFQDTIFQSSGKTTYYSQPLQVTKENATHFYQWDASEENTIVRVIVIEGSPSEEDKENSTDGEAGDNKKYDGRDREKDTTDDDTSQYKKGSKEGSVGLFNDLYLVTNENIRALRSKIWSQDFFNILKVNSNPIDNVVSLKRFPFTMPSGTAENIKIGDIDTGVLGNPVTNGIEEITFNTIKISGIYNNFLDYQGALTIFLPFIGYKALDINTFLYTWIKVTYLVDVCSGACKAMIQQKHTSAGQFHPVLEFDGVMGIDCNLTASTQKQSEIAFLGRVISGATTTGLGIATGNPMGVLSGVQGIANNQVNNTYQSTTCGGSISNAGYLECFIIREFPDITVADSLFYPSGYLESYGMPNMSTCKLSDLHGYVKVGGHVNLADFNATNEEKAEIEELLTKGVVIR